MQMIAQIADIVVCTHNRNKGVFQISHYVIKHVTVVDSRHFHFLFDSVSKSLAIAPHTPVMVSQQSFDTIR